MVTGSFSLVVLLFSKGIITFTNDAKVELRLFFFQVKNIYCNFTAEAEVLPFSAG